VHVGVRMVEPGNPEWEAHVSRLRHDVYHTPGYATVCEASESHPVRLAVVEASGEVLLAPVLVREIKTETDAGSGLVDFSSPYGYPAPLCSSCDTDIQAALLREMLDHFTQSGGVSAFFRSHPFLGLSTNVWEQVGDVVQHGSTVYLDLEAIAADPVASFRADHRRGIRILAREAFTAQAGRWDLYPDFSTIYAENMRRVGAAPSLQFADEYFSSLRGLLPQNTRYLTVTSPSGELAAAAILFTCGDFAQYHLSATSDAFLKDAPVKALFPLMVKESLDAGAKWLHLGGGVGGSSDSLFEFKRGFSKLYADFFTYRVVLDETVYNRLGGQTAPDGFFPAYRYGAK
jgi:Acetyltransferase (GNAT) domain